MISRTLQRRVGLCRGRFISSLLNNPHSVTVDDIKKSNFNGDLQDSIKLLNAINNSTNNNKNEINRVLIPDFSIYFKLPQELINSDVLLRLLQVNPGRVYTSIELFEKYEKLLANVSQDIIKVLIDKIIQGEEYELKELKQDESFKPHEDNLIRLTNLLKKYGINDDLKLELLDKISDDGLLNSLIQEGIISTEVLLKYVEDEKFDSNQSMQYFNILKYLFLNCPELLNIKQVVDILIIGRKLKLQNDEFSEQVLQYIEQEKLDMPAKSLLLRNELIEQYGIYNDDLDKANKLYHKYQSHCKFGIDLIQYQLFKSYIYQSIKTDNDTYLKIAQTLVNPEQLNIRTLQCLIIGNHKHEEEGLKIFNDYINQVSKEVNKINYRSSSGLLTEALILSILYNNDRNLASLIFDKSIENKMIENEFEISQIKSHFKAYGQSFTDNDDWVLAKPNFKLHLLSYIQNL